jgi:small-conductance mechanosensitive channel
MSGPDPNTHHEDRYQPMALIGVTMVALLGFAMFFLGFLVAPLAILMIFYVGFAASDRAKRNGSAARLASEAEARQRIMERADEETATPARTLSQLGA